MWLSAYQPACLSVCLSVCLALFLSVSLSLCLSLSLYLLDLFRITSLLVKAYTCIGGMKSRSVFISRLIDNAKSYVH